MSASFRNLEAQLLANGIDDAVLAEVADQARRAGLSPLEVMQRTDAVDPGLLVGVLAEVTGLSVVEDIDLERVDVELVRQLPLGLAREQGVLPLWEEKGRIVVAISSPEALVSTDDGLIPGTIVLLNKLLQIIDKLLFQHATEQRVWLKGRQFVLW